MRGGRAVIMEDHCVLCGRCLAVCPQEAKTLTSELPQVKAMIRRQQERYGWEFLFLGANIDAAAEASRFGISPDRAAQYCCDQEGTALNYEVISEAVSSVRASRTLHSGWKRRIDEDLRKRGK